MEVNLGTEDEQSAWRMTCKPFSGRTKVATNWFPEGAMTVPRAVWGILQQEINDNHVSAGKYYSILNIDLGKSDFELIESMWVVVWILTRWVPPFYLISGSVV